MPQRLHPQKHAKPRRRRDEKAVPVRGDIPRADLVENGERGVHEAGVEGRDVDEEDNWDVRDEED